MFDATAAGGVVFHAAAGLEAPAVAAVQACVRRRLLRVFVRRGPPLCAAAGAEHDPAADPRGVTCERGRAAPR